MSLRVRGGRARRLAAIAVGTLALVGASAEPHPPDAELATRVLWAAGTGAEIAAVAEVAAAGFAGLDAVPAADRLALQAIVEEGFAPEALERLVLEAHLRRFDAAKAQTALRWLEQPRTAALLGAGRGPATGCDAGAPSSDPARASDERYIESATSTWLRSRRHASRVYAALLRAGNALLPETRRFTHVELADLIAGHDALLRRAPSAAERACRYRDFSSEDLADARAFLEGDAGRWLRISMSTAVAEALDRAAAATAQRIVEEFGAPRPAPVRVADLPHVAALQVAQVAPPRH